MVERSAGSEDRSVSALASLPDSITRHRVLGPEDTAAFLGVTKAQLSRMRAERRLPPPLEFSPRRIGWRVVDLVDYSTAHAHAAKLKASRQDYSRNQVSPDIEAYENALYEMEREFGMI